MSQNKIKLPQASKPVLRVVARNNEANQGGDIFGGWLMSQIDIAGAIIAMEFAKGPVVTRAVKNLEFLRPLFVFDLALFYAELTRVGKTSMTVNVDVYVRRVPDFHHIDKVSEATLVYVAVKKPGEKRMISAAE